MLNKSDFASLISHGGLMCLMDQIVTFDDNSILCRTGSHRSTNNPLRRLGQLSCLTSIEYAAQAMALHGALLAQQDHRQLPQGFIGSLRDAVFHVDRLDALAFDLHIRAHRILTQRTAMMYECEIQGDGQAVFSGCIGVFFPASGGPL